MKNVFPVEAQSDLIERLSKAHPIDALAEFIWNALDADATKVDVIVSYGDIGISEIIIKDNGSGIDVEKSKQFKMLGGSWKKISNTTPKGRCLHGKEGRGRFKGGALGRVVDWHSVYRDEKNSSFKEFNISIKRENTKEVEITKPVKAKKNKTGVTVKITEFDKDFNTLKEENALQSLAEIFALYLKNYPDVSISYQGTKINSESAVKNHHCFELGNIIDDGTEYSVKLELIEWIVNTGKMLYLCNGKGVPLSQIPTKFHVGNFQFSAYLKSPFIQKLHNEGIIELSEMGTPLEEKIDSAKKKITEHFREKASEQSKNLVEQWKEEKIYPFKKSPKNNIQNIEQKVFDIVAVQINDFLPEFATTPKSQKALHLRLLRQAIERSPNDLQVILNEILELPKKKQKELAEILKGTSLSSIITASKMISDRLEFITALEELIFNVEIKKHLKERSQLHRMLAENTWIFGEEFHLSVDDKSLTEVLKKHLKASGITDIVIDAPVKKVDGTKGIVDLMLTRSIKTNKPNELEHLVVELKAPTVKIRQKEINQIESYAFAVANDERFKGIEKTKWDFWVISNDMDDFAKQKSSMKDSPKGMIHKGENMSIWVKTWGEIIHNNKARLQFIQEKLEYQADKGNSLKSLINNYDNIIKNTKLETEIKAKISEEQL